jgi:ADP-heptose:LPS heptosyltransferase
MNAWLERNLLFDYDVCCDWLWGHNRWHTHDEKHNWLNLSQKRSAIDFSKIEKKVKIILRMPNWLGDAVMLIPCIRAVRRARPDGQITLLLKPNLIPFFGSLHIADHIVPLKKGSMEYYRQLLRCRRSKPDFFLRFVNSERGDIETLFLNAKLTLAQRFLHRKRPLFSDSVTMDRKSSERHQVENSHYWFEKMGYSGPWDLSPIDLKIEKTDAIGLICGSANHPLKRWPVPNWIGLIEILLQKTTSTVILFGTNSDAAITQEIRDKFPNEIRLVDRAGKTDTLELAREIAACKLVIGNDTGGAHLSNSLAVPTVSLFGPTDPNEARPFFNAPACVIVAPDRENFASLTPDSVAYKLFELNLLP